MNYQKQLRRQKLIYFFEDDTLTLGEIVNKINYCKY